MGSIQDLESCPNQPGNQLWELDHVKRHILLLSLPCLQVQTSFVHLVRADLCNSVSLTPRKCKGITDLFALNEKSLLEASD